MLNFFQPTTKLYETILFSQGANGHNQGRIMRLITSNPTLEEIFMQEQSIVWSNIQMHKYQIINKLVSKDRPTRISI